MLKVYGFKKVNKMARGNTRDLRILWALEEMQLPYELVGLDHPARELKTEAYHRINPFGQIPAIDDEGVVLTESGAILLYLAKKAGRLLPLDPAGEAQVVRWCFAATNSVEIPLMNIMMVDWMQDEGCRSYRDFLVGWANNHLSGLERWLADRVFIATADFTVADLLMTHVLAVVQDARLLEPYPNVRAYRDRGLARPAWQRTLERYLSNVTPA